MRRPGTRGIVIAAALVLALLLCPRPAPAQVDQAITRAQSNNIQRAIENQLAAIIYPRLTVRNPIRAHIATISRGTGARRAPRAARRRHRAAVGHRARHRGEHDSAARRPPAQRRLGARAQPDPVRHRPRRPRRLERVERQLDAAASQRRRSCRPGAGLARRRSWRCGLGQRPHLPHRPRLLTEDHPDRRRRRAPARARPELRRQPGFRARRFREAAPVVAGHPGLHQSGAESVAHRRRRFQNERLRYRRHAGLGQSVAARAERRICRIAPGHAAQGRGHRPAAAPGPPDRRQRRRRQGDPDRATVRSRSEADHRDDGRGAALPRRRSHRPPPLRLQRNRPDRSPRPAIRRQARAAHRNRDRLGGRGQHRPLRRLVRRPQRCGVRRRLLALLRRSLRAGLLRTRPPVRAHGPRAPPGHRRRRAARPRPPFAPRRPRRGAGQADRHPGRSCR